jgi:hypothetical protein
VKNRGHEGPDPRRRRRRNKLGGGGSAIGPTQEPIGFPALSFRRPAGPTVTLRESSENFSGWRRWTAIDHALGRDRSTDPFGDHSLDDDDPLDTAVADTDLVTGSHRLRGFGRHTVHTHMSASTGGRGGRPSLE